MKAKSYLGWFMNNPQDPKDSPIEIAVECVLSDGTWDDIQTLIKIIGIKKTANLFRENINKWRPYFRPIDINYLTLYFNEYSPQKNSNKI